MKKSLILKLLIISALFACNSSSSNNLNPSNLNIAEITITWNSNASSVIKRDTTTNVYNGEYLNLLFSTNVHTGNFMGLIPGDNDYSDLKTSHQKVLNDKNQIAEFKDKAAFTKFISSKGYSYVSDSFSSTYNGDEFTFKRK